MKIVSLAFKTLAFIGVLYLLAACNSDRLIQLASQTVAYIKPDLEAAGNGTFGAWWDCRQTLGNPSRLVNGIAQPDPAWEAENLVKVVLPWRGHAAWDQKLVVKSLQVHRDTAASLQRALAKIWQDAGKSQAEIDRLGLSSVGGAFNWRKVREGQGLSAHAYGCAVDFDPGRNGLGNTASNFSKADNQYVVKDFQAEGWAWGGDWPRPDAMHFQATSLATNTKF